MRIISEGLIAGPEARGFAVIAIDAHGDTTLTVSDSWGAPGASDVRLFVTARDDAAIDDSATDLDPIQDGASRIELPLPDEINTSLLAAVVVYCKVFSVQFGSARLSPPDGSHAGRPQNQSDHEP